MPLHPRAEIRAAIVAALAGKTAAGSRVFSTRVIPLRKVEIPALAVFVRLEEVDVEGSQNAAPLELDRMADVLVEGYVEAGENVDDALDALSLEVEAAMGEDITFGGKAARSLLARTELEVMDEGDRLRGLAQWTFRVQYFSYVTTAQPTDDLERAGATWDVAAGGQHPDDRAEDLVEVEPP